MIQPIFIFSLPRSGSTLLQKILGTHPEISTTSEPWILLPCVFSLRDQGILTEYSHWRSAVAIKDFCRTLPQGEYDYYNEIQNFIISLYAKNSGNERYFLDKTPRYHLIIEDIMRIFPNGKFIFLWRNPLAIVASIIESFGHGYWNLYDYRIDLFKGLTNLLEMFDKAEVHLHSLRYEDLVSNPQSECERIFRYLDLPFDPDILITFKTVNLAGEFGDQIGINKYASIDNSSLEKWKTTINNPVCRTPLLTSCQYRSIRCTSGTIAFALDY
jgi:hypothetical protein